MTEVIPSEPMTQTATAVLVLGMHRSGTSAVARVLNLLGVDLGEDLLPPAADNVTGFWEHRQIQFIHDRIYEQLGRDWTNVSALPPRWWESADIAQWAEKLLRQLVGDFGGRPLWGIKDPRLAAMLPVWRPVLDRLHVRPACVLIARSPAEVVRSLSKRDGLSPSRTYLLWLRNLVDSVTGSAGLPRSITTYQRVLDDWRSELSRVGRNLNLDWPIEDASGADQFLQPDHRHHVISDGQFLADETVPPLVRRAYGAVLDAARSGEFDELTMAVDDIATELDGGHTELSGFVADFEAEHRRTVIAKNVAELEAGGRIGQLQADVATERAATEAASAEWAKAHAQAGRLSVELQQSQSQTAGVETARIAVETARAELERLLGEATRQLAATTAESVDRLSKLESSRSNVSELNDEIGRRRKAADELSAEFDRAKKAAAKTASELQAVRGELRLAYHTRDALGESLRRTFDSKLWRWGRPAWWLARAMGWLNVYRDRLVPLTPSTRNSDHTWTGSAQPVFLVPVAPLIGWVRVRAVIQSSASSRAALYLDTGGGFHQREHVELGPVAGESVIDRMIPLKQVVYQLRFDPVQAPGEYVVRDFRVEPLSAVWFNTSAVLRNVRRMIRGTGAHRPSIWIGLKLLFSGKWLAFHHQLVSNVESTTAVSEYDLWIKRHEITDARRQQMREAIAGWKNPPRISVVVPVYNVAEEYLRKCIESVTRQTYPHWELCLVDDASPKRHVRKVLDEYAKTDRRIKVKYQSANGGISKASNAAMEMATGDYVALLDHDDEITEHALFAVAERIVAEPATDLIYSDEDKISPAGKRTDPFFKPDWSPEYFLACMYTCHLGVYRTEMLRKIGGWRSEYDSAQDYDLVLRAVATHPKIAHIPDVLYHWRTIPTSTAAAGGAKPEAYDRARKALQSYVDSTGRPGRVEPGPSLGFHRVRFDVVGNPMVSIVIPSACREVTLRDKQTWFVLECVRSIRQLSTYGNLEVIVLDNDDMTDELAAALKPYDVRKIPFTEPFNLARKMNLGGFSAQGEHLILLNDDIEVITPDWVESMLEYSQLPDVGVVGAQLLFPNDTQQHNGVNVLDGNPGHPFYGSPADHPGYYFSSAVHRNWSAVTGACLMTRADVYREVGGFSESFPLNYNDVDYCLKVIQTGRRIVQMPYSRLYHHESVSKAGTDEAELKAFKTAWADKIPVDPYYNVNLTTQTCDFRISDTA